jgi:hypothetical protein
MRITLILRADVSVTILYLHGVQVANDQLIVDYNSWVESEKGLKLAAGLDKNVVLAEGAHHPIYLTEAPFTY